MHRVLVVAEPELLAALQALLEPGGKIEVRSATTPRVAALMTRIERPQVVVFRETSLGMPLTSFFTEVRKNIPEDQLPALLCVDDAAETCGDTGEDSDFHRCSREGLGEEVVALLPTQSGPKNHRQRLELFAATDRLLHKAQAPTFSNLLELGERDLLLETQLPLEVGERLTLNFFPPRAYACTAARIVIQCLVSKVVDLRRLHYEADIDHPDTRSRESLSLFLTEHRQTGKA